MTRRGAGGVFAHYCCLGLYLYYLLLSSHFTHAADVDSNNSNDHTTADDTPEHTTRRRWADAAFNYVKSLNCSSVYFTSVQDCHHLLNLRKRDIVVYVAQPDPASAAGRPFVASLPDGDLTRAGTHRGVVALDPYPEANFGHLVVVFFIDRRRRAACERELGIYIGEQECLTLALKHRCKNAVERRWRRLDGPPSDRLVRRMIKKCEINFLPHVYEWTDETPATVNGISQGYEQALTCREDLLDYSLCPSLRPANETLDLVCNPIRDNTRRCETTHEAVGTTCRTFESCDQAVLISGGWNRQLSQRRHQENAVGIYHLLRRNGFHQQAIKVFFANGMHGGISEESGEESENTEVLPAAMKTSMRLHIQKLCRTPHCVDTLVLYLNSPSKTDGTMLLWDVNKDGQASADEQYTLRELLADLDGCHAHSVQIIADQSFSGEITRAIKKSSGHGNVVAFASSKDHQYSYGTRFTDIWTGLDHSHLCTQNVYQIARSSMMLSTPEMYTKSTRGGDSVGPVTLVGAPCNVDPPFTQNELRLYYRGCQRVPTEVWLRTFFQNTASQSGLLGPSLSFAGSSNQLSGLLDT